MADKPAGAEQEDESNYSQKNCQDASDVLEDFDIEVERDFAAIYEQLQEDLYLLG